LILSGHADRRGPKGYNQALSERRLEITKRFLVEQGVPEGNIETQAYGEEQNLSTDQVKQLLEQDPNLSEEAREKALKRLDTIVLAKQPARRHRVETLGARVCSSIPLQRGRLHDLSEART
jgi:outer membrane protein OmpA-like peptidoglycan-associated protein